MADIYKQCPTLETEHFKIRLVQIEDAENLLACYSNPKAQELFNVDSFPNDCCFNTIEEMEACIEFWLTEYAQEAYIRFSIVCNTTEKAIGTIEMFGTIGAYKADPGILRIDIAPDYENETHLTEILTICTANFFDMFGVTSIVTKAVPQAAARINALAGTGFHISNFNGREHYYAIQQKSAKTLSPLQLLERSIHKKFRKTLWKPFVSAIQKYELLKEGDSIAVCISGGKDSMLLAKLMQALHRYSDYPFHVEYIVMNPGYNEINLQRVVANAAKLDIPIKIFNSNIFEVVTSTDRSPCYLCARMRRGHLYSYARELGCNKIALGHHFNDVVETTLMGMLFGAQVQTMMPKVKSKNFSGLELVRPMYSIHEDTIIAWKRYNNLEFIQCACPLAENCNVFDASGGASKRQEVKTLLKNLKRENKDVEKSIFQSIHSVNLDTIIGYKLDDKEYSFLDRY